MFEIKETGTKKFTIVSDDSTEILKLDLVPSSISNKFFIVINTVKTMADKVDGFGEWFLWFLMTYKENSEERFRILEAQTQKIKDFVEEYLKALAIDFSLFVDESKAKKNSILFTADEVEKIIRLSTCLKIYSVLACDKDLKLNQHQHKKIYNIFAADIGEEIIHKVFTVIQTKTYRYNLTDSYMWDYIRMVQCKEIDVHIVEIFNFIMNSILVLCQEERNPITYFVSVIDDAINWFLRSVYKGTIIYGDSVAKTDLHQLGHTQNSFLNYTYNDTIGRVKGIAYEKAYELLEEPSGENNTDQSLVDFQNRITKIEFISPICQCLTYPLLARVLDIPYSIFKTLSAEHSAVISVYVYNLLSSAFKGRYESLFELLNYYTTKEPVISTTYKIKGIQYYFNLQADLKSFYGFDTQQLPYKILSYFCGRLSRVALCNTMSGKELVGLPLSKVEKDLIQFYVHWFVGPNSFKKELNDIRERIFTSL